MKKTYRLSGLDCANCAAKMQTQIGRLKGVTCATVNFLTAKMVIDAEDAYMDEAEKSAFGIIRKLEPQVVVKPL